MRLLSGGCSCCGKRRSLRLPATKSGALDVLICPDCDTAVVSMIPGSPRGCPPNMPGADNGYVYPRQQEPDTPEGDPR